MQNRTLLLMILAGVGCGVEESGTACLDVAEDATECPAASDVAVADLDVPLDCDGLEVVSIAGSGTFADLSDGQLVETGMQNLGCCYDAVLRDPKPNQDCAIGRPYRESGRVVLAPVEVSAAGRASAWAHAGAAEHASVAAFAKLAMELMAHGAPTDLLSEVFAAGRDEVVHAELCFARAEALGGVKVQPGKFPFVGEVGLGRSLAEVAVDAAREGCVGETIGAVLARRAAERATEPEVRAAFERIAADEERHAVLSWRIVAWAVRVGGDEVRSAVAAAFREPAPRFDLAELALRAGVGVDAFTDVVGGAVREVVRPAVTGVMAA